jgi:Arc/MetJ-type ribon-helix-helix transcriptional regulator
MLAPKELKMSVAETLTVEIPESLMKVVRERVAAGDYRSEEEAVVDALDLWSGDQHAYGDDDLRAMALEALDDPTPPMTLEDLHQSLDREHQSWVAGQGRAG